VFYISAKPSKARAAQFARQSELNARIRTFASSRTDLTFVDVVPAMMTDGRPRDIFVEDGLHMSAAGYAIWREQIGRVLREKEIARARCPD
jgi:lysophospholipase L1-like esterase